MIGDEGEKNFLPSIPFAYKFHANLRVFTFLLSVREKENLLSKAAENDISSQEVNKLRSQAADITFDDITECIEVSLSCSILCNLYAFACVMLLNNKQCLDLIIKGSKNF